MPRLTSTLTDAVTKREDIHRKAVEGLQDVFPIQAGELSVEIENPYVQAKDFSSRAQKDAILHGHTLQEPLRADVLIKRDGKVIDRKKAMTLGQIPYFNQRHTFVVDGNEYSVSNQKRVRPGVYTRVRGNEQLEAAFNLGKGENFRINMDPAKGHMFLQYGSTNIPLYPILKQMGVNDTELKKHWGAGMVDLNRDAFKTKQDASVTKLYERLVPAYQRTATVSDSMGREIQKRYQDTQLDPEVTEKTLGKGFKHVTPETMMLASKKLLDVHRKGEDTDDRDSLAFQTLHGVEDFLKERIQLEGRRLQRKVRIKASSQQQNPTVEKIMPAAPFTRSLRNFLTTATLSAIPAQINPIEILDSAVRVTSLGEGGIGSERAVPSEARRLHHTHFGVLDPGRTPECHSSDTEVYTKQGWKYWSEVTEQDLLACKINGQPRFHRPKHLVAMHYCGPMLGLETEETGYLVTPNHRMRCQHPNKASWCIEYAEDIHHKPRVFDIGYKIPHVTDETVHGYFEQAYDDLVYCAEVPGGLLYTRRKGKPPLWLGNSFRAGIDLRTSIWTKKDNQGHMYTLMRNARTGKLEDVPLRTLEHSTIAFSGEADKQRNVSAMRMGEIRSVSRKDVDYDLPHPSFQFSPATNLVPMPESLQGNRIILGSKMATQALPLVGREAPLVQVQSFNPGRTFEQELADRIVPSAPVSGKIKKIDEDYIYLRPDGRKSAAVSDYPPWWETQSVLTEKNAEVGGVPLIKIPYDTNFPLASKTRLHNTIIVKEGDHVDAKQHLAGSNFTKDGVLALGKNLQVGYMAYYGANSNDAVVISAGGAIKLTSEHMYKESIALDDDVVMDKNKHRARFGMKWTAKQYDNLDEKGVAKSGVTVQPGDPIIIVLRKTQPTAEQKMLGKLHRSLTMPFREDVVTWEHKSPGTVMDVVVTPRRVLVTVATEEAAGVGDKLSGRYGNKGVISQIIPDDQMVQTPDGKPIDILMTSAGIVSRINPAQIIETAVSKVAEKTGKPIVVPSMSGRDNVKWARGLLKEHGLSDKEILYNPVTGKNIVGPDGKGVMTGKQYIYKLFKSTDTNYAARGIQDYDINLQPSKGGTTGAKSLGRMEIDALIAHNARDVLREASTIKSSRNDEFWTRYQLGQAPPKMQTSFAYNKFTDMLQGAGIKIDKSNEKLTLGPMTDADITKVSAGALTKATMIREKDFTPERGGLFDPVITGGTQGNRWSHIALTEPLINPTFEDPVRRLLGMTKQQFRDTLRSKGGGHIQQQLKDIDVTQREKELRAVNQTATGATLDQSVKQLKALRALRKIGLSPDQAYVVNKLAVVPPVVRPILPSQGRRDLLIADANYLYRDAMLANDALAMAKKDLPDEVVGDARMGLYDSTRALFGLAAPVSPQLQARDAKGFITTIAGQGSPKRGFFHGKVIKRPQNLSGRGTAAPDMTLDMDQVGLPEEMLWATYEPHIVRRMVQNGYKAMLAKEMVEARHSVARDALMVETKLRPVIINRAPTLHRFGMVGAHPVPVPGMTIRVNPFIEKGLNLDFDGDSVDCDLDTYQKSEYIRLHISNFPRQESSMERKDNKETYTVPPGIQVFSYDEGTRRAVLRDVTHFSVHHDLEMLDVALSSKRHVKVSRDASMYAVNPDTWVLERVNAEDAIGWATPRPRYLHQERTPLETVALPKHTWTLDAALGQFLGTFVGDGWVSGEMSKHRENPYWYWKTVGLANTEVEIKDAYVQYAQTLMSEPLNALRYDTKATDKGSYGDSTKYHLNSMELASKVAELMDDVRGAHNKHLPRCFVNAPRPFLLGLLGGLIDTDGSISKVQAKAKPKPQWMCNYTSVSKRLVDEIAVLLTMLGVKSGINHNKLREGKRQAYTLTISLPDLARIGHEIPLASTHKRELLQQMVTEFDQESVYNMRWDNVPISTETALALACAVGSPKHGDTPEKRARITLYMQLHKSKKNQRLSRLALQRTVDCLGAEHVIAEGGENWFNLVTNENIFFDFIEEANQLPGRHTAWDLTVPGSNTFMTSNQVVVYDTLQIHVPVSDGAIKDTKSITLSNQLFGDKTKSDLLVFPQHEAIIGIHEASRATGGKLQKFKTTADALAAYKRGEIKIEDKVEIG